VDGRMKRTSGGAAPISPARRAKTRKAAANIRNPHTRRGYYRAAEEFLARCACRTSPCTLKDIWERHLAGLDINPLMVLPSGQGVKAVDALVVFRGP
jgi:hypothetical protein